MRQTMQKVMSLVLAAGLLAGCSAQSSTATASAAATTAAAAESTAAETENTGATLVVYFSGTGNTRAVAETIADTVGADLYELTPVDPYTEEDLDWTNADSRVSQEHENETLQDQVELTTTTVENWDSYDVVFFGYPIWWGNAAWPVRQFIADNDFTGKTVIPFCTSASSGIGSSGQDLAALAGTGDWQEGQRFASQADASEVAAWAEDVLAG